MVFENKKSALDRVISEGQEKRNQSKRIAVNVQ